MALVTLEQVKDQLSVDTNAWDAWINLAITDVESAVKSWIKDEWRLYELLKDESGDVVLDSSGEPVLLEDSSGQPLVRGAVRRAILVEISVQFRFRDGDGAPAVPSNWGHGHVLSAGATSLLAAMRKSTIA